MFFALFGALFGFWLGGLRGLLLGGALGYGLQLLARSVLRRGLTQLHGQFVESTFAVAGALSKADGVVTRDEIEVVQQLFERLRLNEEQISAAKAAFQRGKASDFDLDAEVDKFARMGGRSPLFLQSFLQVQMSAALADGQVHPKEHQMLVRVARRLGLSERQVEQLEALLRAAAYASTSSEQQPGVPRQGQLDDAYEALGVRSDASDAEVKRAYRKLISENHPDKLASRGLPEGVRELAEEHVRNINAAYDLIKRARGF